MVRLPILGLFLTAALTTVAATPATCIDDLTWRYNDEEGKDCGWVGRNAGNRCDRMDNEGVPFRNFCPVVCNDCGDEQPDQDECLDDPDFRFNLEEKKTCLWVGTNPNNRCVRTWMGRPVHVFCPETCGMCGEDSVDNDGPCEDDETFLYRNNPNRSCIDWVAQDSAIRCHDHFWTGKPLSHFCPVTCNTCPEEEEEEEEDNEGCCSLNYRDCIGWCGTTQDTCGNCNNKNSVIWLEDGAPQSTCTKRWSECDTDSDSCCPGLECRANANNVLACRPELPIEDPSEDSEEVEDNGCCSLDYKQCIGWCGPTKDSCLGCNHHDGVGWLNEGSAENTNCKARWTGCYGRPNSCCPGLECRPDPNNWMACLPALYTDAPTFAPTETTTIEPTPVEEESEDSGAEGCCSLDYKQCIGWCGPTRNSCLGCNHHDGVGWLTNGSVENSQCKPRWTGCSGSPNSCCPGLECRRDPNNWLACLPALG